MIAAAHKSSGKTVVSSGIASALAARGHSLGLFKKGPDYIDPMWLRLAGDAPAYNLDFNTMTDGEITALFQARATGRDVNLIEANKGLYDGVAADGSDSNAAMAKLLQAPVVLVVDTKGMTRGIAPLLQGYLAFDWDVQIAGVILNKTGGTRHEGKLRAAVEGYTDLTVLGAIGNSRDLDISERHLGLTTPADCAVTKQFLDGVGEKITDSVDLDRIIEIARAADPLPSVSALSKPVQYQGMRIGIAEDAACAFYYQDDLEAFRAAGVELVPIDLIHDRALPKIDGLFIGGGFPETHAAALAANVELRRQIRDALENGLPAYAECGGLMYLCRSLTWHGETHEMVGFFEADTVMHRRPQGRGHVRFTPTSDALWQQSGGEMRAHEFHYASLENLSDPVFARNVTRGFGIDGKHDALVKKKTQAGFIHLRHTTQTPWVTDFLSFVAAHRA